MESLVNLSVEELQSYYLRKPFLKKLYHYYIHQGYYNIISEQLVYIINNSFVLFYTLFLMKCVYWDKLFKIDSPTNLSSIVNMKNMFKLNLNNVILVIIYFFYLMTKIGYLISSIYNYKYIKHFYNNILKISDLELINYKWEKIINKFYSLYKNEDINVYYINNKITIQDNYFISLIDKDVIEIKHLCPLMEWNIIYCFINPIFVNDYKYNRNFIYLNESFVKKVQAKILAISILNFILMPLLMPFMCLRNLFKYGEKFYNNPSLITSKHWTHYAKWKYRNYNELYHEYHEKIQKSYKVANVYNNQFPIKLISTISELFIFILSSFFIILIFVSIINENVLTNFYIIPNKNTLWLIGLLATLIALLKKTLKEQIFYNSDDKLAELKKIINCIDEKNTKDKNHKEYFFNMYQYHTYTFIKDIYYTLNTPFELFKLYYRTYDVLKFLSEITIDDPKIGHTNIYSTINKNIDDIKNGYSKQSFHINNPEYLSK